jgi:hypothetical protein
MNKPFASPVIPIHVQASKPDDDVMVSLYEKQAKI